MNTPSERKNYTKLTLIVATWLSTVLATAPAMAFDTDGCGPINVSEFDDYQVVYQFAVPDNSDFDTAAATYVADNSATVGQFDRVAYCVELDTGAGLQWVWVSADAFTDSADQLGIPTSDAAANFQQTIENMSVFSNVAGVVTGSGIATGNIEFWHNDYSPVGGLGLAGGNPAAFDFDDTIGVANAGGSMQIHNFGSGDTIFGYNSWDNAAVDDLGIGTNGSGSPDWTSAANAASYTARKDIYVLVRQVEVFTAAGTGVSGFSGDGGPAVNAQFDDLVSVSEDPSGNLYVADFTNNRVRRIDPAGNITTFAGTGVAGFSGDGGAATAAELNGPISVVSDSAGNIYIAELNNNRVRRVDTGGTITTVAGTGGVTYNGDGIPATTATLDEPWSVDVDSADNLYIADREHHRIRRVDSGGTITTVAGTGVAGFSGDSGAATSAQIRRPYGVHIDFNDDLIIADTDNGRIRRVDSGGTITTIAGIGGFGFVGDGGPATSAQFRSPRRVGGDDIGNLYIVDHDNHRIRRIATDGTITTFAGTGVENFDGDGRAPDVTELASPFDVLVADDGTIYIADFNNERIRVVLPATDNNAPTGVTLSNTTISNAGGANALVGTLDATDADLADAHVFTLISNELNDPTTAAFETDNDLFTITGDELFAIDSSALMGTYQVRVQADDQVDGTFVEQFTITVADGVPPVITLVGVSPQTIEAGQPYVESGATATDNVDGDITASIVIDSSAVDTATPGSYAVTYNVSDAAGNAAVTVTRTVDVVDTTAPTITLIGANPQVIEAGGAYAELGASATDIVDGDISAAIVIDASAVMTLIPASYNVLYDVADAAGNAATTQLRTVNVVDTTPPTVMNCPMNLTVGAVGGAATAAASFAEPTATDVVDGAVAGVLEAGLAPGSQFPLGDTTVRYRFTDANANSATCEFIVSIVADFDGDGDPDVTDPDDDADGVDDVNDAFPLDPNETADADGDGVGDNGDAFPNDPNETADTDGDGVGDNGDAFPNDPNETVDTDNDGVGDNGDVFPNDPNESADSDGDGVGDNGDPFPNDPNQSGRGGELALALSALPAPAMVGDTVSWTLQLNNSGPDTATAVDLAGLAETNGLALTSDNPACTLVAGAGTTTDISCALGDLISGAAVEIVFTTAETVTAGDLYAAFAVSSANPGPLTDDNSASLGVAVAERLSLGPSQSAGSAIIQAGVSGDIDNDGDVDLISAGGPGASSEIFLNDGTGAFAAPIALGDMSSTNALALVDVNGDGALDLVAANGNGESDTVYLNDGAGGFAAQQSLGMTDSRAVVALDINGDTFVDIVVASASGVIAYSGDGAGNFGAGVTLAMGDATAIAAADLNGDMLVDLIVAYGDRPAETRISDGAGTFNLGQTLPDTVIRDITVVDVDSDGDVDIVLAVRAAIGSLSLPANSVYLNDGNGVFVLGSTFGAANTERSVSGDFNGDGVPDVFVINAQGTHQLYVGDGAGGFTLFPVQVSSVGAASLTAGDFNNDGLTDVVIGNGDVGGTDFYLNAGDGGVGLNQRSDLSIGAGSLPPRIAIGADASPTITIRNAGPDEALQVQVTLSVTSELTLNGQSTASGTCTATGNDVVCDLGTIDSGSSASIVLDLTGAFSGTGVISGSVTTSSIEIAPADNDFSVELPVQFSPTTRVGGGGGSSGPLMLLVLLLTAVSRTRSRRSLPSGASTACIRA